eukprot:CAMPEP_0197607832 /NCGR_PEP_ID=MMETSP1326-20131121/47889_1 /TAXON_ID=1155430 /ORGANISM="Genus nov. species nov., Strain RCC2288" /LENGTH=858 /DNA_ID=CAMNT_0043175941 /DNA_START=220 /DNA_END=2796 /DNA_ORIENTATION=+
MRTSTSQPALCRCAALLLLVLCSCAPSAFASTTSDSTTTDQATTTTNSTSTDSSTRTAAAAAAHSTSTNTAHPHYALTYLVFMLSIGALCYQFDAEIPIPYTVTLLVAGMLIGLVHEASDHGLGSLSVSINMWTQIDPHVLLFTFLPALLFGDAISMEFSSIRKAFGQMLLLATAGVALGAFLCALVPMYVFDYGWNWNYCMLIGSILAATDPVAVVSMLKECGASQNLSTIIAGEAMLNDGTAVVFYLLFLDLATGATYTTGEIVKFFAQMALAGPAVGIAVGMACVWWIMRGKDATIEITLFFIAAYAAMIASEQEGGASGVLAVVAAGIFVATFAWPYVDDHHSMHHVWHWLEWVGNTLIFLLAGTILGAKFHDTESIRAVDWGYMFLNWVAINVARFVVVAALFPFLRNMGSGLTWQEAVFMAWGGLRGAVGLAMAIAVAHTPQFHGADGERFLFHVGGMALLTLVINGTTGAALLKRLGLLDQTPAQLRHINDARHKLSLAVAERYDALAQMKRLFSDHDPEVLQLVVAKAADALFDTSKARHSMSSLHILDSLTGDPRSPGGGQGDDKAGDVEFLATIRDVFLNSLCAEYGRMIQAHELPQASGNVLLHSTKMALDDSRAAGQLTTFELLRNMLQSKGSYMRYVAGTHLSDPRSQLTILLCFIEAHNRTAIKVFDVFGAGEGADSVEETMFEREVEDNTASAEEAIGMLGLGQDDIKGERTTVMIKMLEHQITGVVESFVAQGIISGSAGKIIASDIHKGIKPPTEAETATGAAARRTRKLWSMASTSGGMKKSASGLLQMYSRNSSTGQLEELEKTAVSQEEERRRCSDVQESDKDGVAVDVGKLRVDLHH